MFPFRFSLHPCSESQGLLAGTMRHFRTKVYFKSWRVPGNLFLTNQFQKWSNSFRWLGRKIFFCPIRENVLLGNSVAFLHEVVFFIDLVLWSVQRGDCGDFRKKKFNDAEEIVSLNMGARNRYYSIHFLGGFMEGLSQIFIANVRDFYTVAFGCGES